MTDKKTIVMSPSDITVLVTEAVGAAIKGVRAEDARRAEEEIKAENDRLFAEATEAKRKAEVEAGRPPRRRNVERKEVDELARKFRAGSSVKVKIHRRFRAAAHREGDDRGEPPRMAAVHPDEIVHLPVHPEAMGTGQSPRELAHASLTGMFELA